MVGVRKVRFLSVMPQSGGRSIREMGMDDSFMPVWG